MNKQFYDGAIRIRIDWHCIGHWGGVVVEVWYCVGASRWGMASRRGIGLTWRADHPPSPYTITYDVI